MKKLIYAGAAFILTIASSISAAQATGRPGDAKFSHLVDSAAYPRSATFQGATHQFEVHVQGYPLSELSINLPEDIDINDGIEVKNQSGQKIPATVSIKDGNARVVFSQPVPPETTLKVAMQGVNTPGYGNTWQYMVFTKNVGLSGEIPIGMARILTYRD